MSKQQKHAGIPADLGLDFVENWVKQRLSEKRYRHCQGVVTVARQLAPLAPCDLFLAELSAWLHDACKEVKDSELIKRAQKAKLKLHPVERLHGHVLHGPVAALTARKELGIRNQDVLDAISQHTLGHAPMSALSKTVFLADCLEASRPADYTTPIWEALDLGGRNCLDAAVLTALNLGLSSLINSNKPIHPKTIDVRNYYLVQLGDAGR
jgi:predicted HD superfamily hydrolase involved in NAD metabolism